MPIVERDPWRRRYFEGVACPEEPIYDRRGMGIESRVLHRREEYERARTAGRRDGVPRGAA